MLHAGTAFSNQCVFCIAHLFALFYDVINVFRTNSINVSLLFVLRHPFLSCSFILIAFFLLAFFGICTLLLFLVFILKGITYLMMKEFHSLLVVFSLAHLLLALGISFRMIKVNHNEQSMFHSFSHFSEL